MIFKCIVFSLIVLYASCQEQEGFPSGNQYLFGFEKVFPFFNQLNLFDGPATISGAPINSTIAITTPTRDEMMYYNYYTDAVYCPFELKSMDCGSCAIIKKDITDFVVLENSTHDTLALVAVSENRKEIVVSFRGTQNLWNWVLDAYFINASPDGADQIKIHRGFYIAVMSLYERIVKAIVAYQLSKEEYKSYKLVVTGHSLGAAMARVAEFLLLYLNQFPGICMEVYTYGEPRSGNKFYVDFLNGQSVKTARIVNRADLVPHVPPTSLFGTAIVDYYYHTLDEYWLSDDGEKFGDQSLYEDPTCSKSLGPIYSPIDHAKYFDVNHFRCIFIDLQEVFAIPVIFNPTDILPSFPKPIRIALSEIGDFVLAATHTFG